MLIFNPKERKEIKQRKKTSFLSKNILAFFLIEQYFFNFDCTKTEGCLMLMFMVVCVKGNDIVNDDDANDRMCILFYLIFFRN